MTSSPLARRAQMPIASTASGIFHVRRSLDGMVRKASYTGDSIAVSFISAWFIAALYILAWLLPVFQYSTCFRAPDFPQSHSKLRVVNMTVSTHLVTSPIYVPALRFPRCRSAAYSIRMNSRGLSP